MTKLAIISGGVREPSSTRLLADRIPTIRTDEVFRNQVYQPLNPGVGYGVLRFRETATLGAQPVSPTDLVVLDRVPNEVSMVAGIITAEFQTPLAHVGVLAKTRGTPNMALRSAWTDERLRPLGAVSAEIRGYGETLTALESAQMVPPRAAAGSRLALDLLSRPDGGGGRRVVTVPVSAQNGALYLGPVRMVRLEPIPFPVR